MTMAFHGILASLLFLLVNWIGKHAVDFGYVSTTLFEEPNEGVAINFFLRALSPAIFIISVSALSVLSGYPLLRIDIFWVAIYYYIIRAAVIFLLNREGLISWSRYIGHAAIGIAASLVAYKYLILPNRSLLPNLDQAGNEVWLAIFAFLYAVANKVALPDGPGARRRNGFVKRHYNQARHRFGNVIDAKIEDDILKLILYSVLVYEDYCRPPAIRRVERAIWWKKRRTTGIMQVASDRSLSDWESVEAETNILLSSWARHASDDDDVWVQVRSTIADYNQDDDYISKVQEVMEIIAKRVSPEFRSAYDKIYGE